MSTSNKCVSKVVFLRRLTGIWFKGTSTCPRKSSRVWQGEKENYRWVHENPHAAILLHWFNYPIVTLSTHAVMDIVIALRCVWSQTHLQLYLVWRLRWHKTITRHHLHITGVKTATKNDGWDKLVMCHVWNLLIKYQDCRVQSPFRSLHWITTRCTVTWNRPHE